MRRLLQVFCVLMLSLVVTTPVLAQQSNWREVRTERFAILYAENDRASADEYAAFVDAIYDEIAAIFVHNTATPVTLRLYPSLERYYDINPSARNLPGVVAHADFRRHEVVVIVPQTASQTPDEIQNNIRHELTHIVASDLTDNRLNVLFHEGIAQYVEHPSRELEAKVHLLRQASDSDRLLRWSELDDRDRFYGNAQISYPQSLSIVAYLVERYSFAKLREFLTVSARSSGYRSALERTYGVSPDTLEREWRAWLPEYLNGGYRRSALSSYDLSIAETLLREGRYADAERELNSAIEWLSTTEQASTLQHAQQLIERSRAGQRAELLAQEARAALERSAFGEAAQLVEDAQRSYAALGDTRQEAVLSEYAERAQRGLRANDMREEAVALAQAWRYPEARAVADRALAEYTALGATSQANELRDLRNALDQRQSLLGMLLFGFGIFGILASLWRRVTVREAEAW